MLVELRPTPRAGRSPRRPGAHVRLTQMEKLFVLTQPRAHGASARLRPKLMFSSGLPAKKAGSTRQAPGPCQGGSARRPRPRAHLAPVPGLLGGDRAGGRLPTAAPCPPGTGSARQPPADVLSRLDHVPRAQAR